MKHTLTALLAATSLLGGLAASAPARACGGFFCSQAQPVNQAAERIIFADNGDGTITAVIQILYEGPAERFSWLLPISSVPQDGQLGVASDIAFTRLQAATNPQYNLTTVVEGECRASRVFNGVAPSGAAESSTAAPDDESPVSVEASGVIGSFDYAVISVDAEQSDPVASATEWLTENGYDIPPSGAELIRPYLADGMYLLALRLTKGSTTGSIRPLQITYAAEAPMIPIKLTAVAANEDMGVMTWALASSRAVPFNYKALELNEARINWFNASSNYEQVVTEAADEAGGQGFVTEFAGPSSELAEVVWSASDEQQWQQIRSRTYQRLGELLSVLYGSYNGYSGFSDAVRTHVTLPAGVSAEDFAICPQCYADDAQFTPAALLDAIDEEVLEPVRGVQELIDGAPYATRLYSTLSAAEMTDDPVFVFNPDLPPVNNIHTATRVIECGEDVSQGEASWRIELPQGGSIRGAASSAGQWPAAAAAFPSNLRVLALSTSGEGAVVADNGAAIERLLADHNARVPTTSGSSGGFCGVGGARELPSGLAWSAGALLGAVWVRRASRRRSRI